MLRDILGILTGISLALTLWRWLTQLRFPLHRRPATAADFVMPGVTFLKPLKGCDAHTKDCLRSWLEQERLGPAQFLFGVAAADDPVCAIVRELLAEFPKADAELVVCGEALGANNKVSTLRQLEPLIKHPLLVISDADTRPPSDFTASVAPLARGDTGLVNCFYRLANPVTMAMRWEAVAINADFWTQVLQAASFQKLDFALGAVMTLPAAELKAIGGFAALSDYLADDYQIGNRIAANGRRVLLATVAVDCWEPPTGWGGVWRHQLRWARTIRACRPAAFFFSVLNNPSIWPVLLLEASAKAGGWGLALGGAALAFRVATAAQQQARMERKGPRMGDLWLVWLKDVLDFYLWALAFWGNEIEWRGVKYRIGSGGKLTKI